MANKLKKGFKTVAFMTGVTFVTISLVSLIYLFNRDAIKANETLLLRRAVLAATGADVPKTANEVNHFFESKIKAIAESRYGVDGGGIVVLQKWKGLWGTIEAAVGIDADGTLTGLSFVAQSETPGLGARIAEPWFTDQFCGRKLPVKIKSADRDGFDGITGATITTKAVRDMLNAIPKESGNGQ